MVRLSESHARHSSFFSSSGAAKMGVLLDSPAEKPLTKTCAAKLVALSFILCFLIRLAILDPLGIAPATAAFVGNERATVTHVVIMQFRDDVSPEVIEWVSWIPLL